MADWDCVVVGAGPAGLFAAAFVAARCPRWRIGVFFQEKTPLSHFGQRYSAPVGVEVYDPRELSSHYLAGDKELRGVFARFGPAELFSWCEERGLDLDFRDDGVYAPPRALAEALLEGVETIHLRPQWKLRHIDARSTGGFWLTPDTGDTVICERLLIAAGDLSTSALRPTLGELGHNIEPLGPAFFGLQVKEANEIGSLAGLETLALTAINEAELTEARTLRVEPWGFSGPAIWQLTAMAEGALSPPHLPREFFVSWWPEAGRHVRRSLDQIFRAMPNAALKNGAGEILPEKLWEMVLARAGLGADDIWKDLSKSQLSHLERTLSADKWTAVKRKVHQGETGTRGGVSLPEINFRRMESSIQPGIFFAGDCVAFTGMPGGFQLQASFATAAVAAAAIAEI